MNQVKIISCNNCGASLHAEINREFIFCSYCGSKNIIESEGMKTNISIEGINIAAKTDLDSILASVKYAISIKKYDKANEMLMAAILSGGNDYRVYICKAMIDLQTDDNNSLFHSLETLRTMESAQVTGEITEAINEFMQYRGCAGLIALHVATFHERFDLVEFCVTHKSDVNCIARTDCVSPVSIMFVPIPPGSTKLDDTPFVRNKTEVKRIRQYLMQHGAKDKRRLGY